MHEPQEGTTTEKGRILRAVKFAQLNCALFGFLDLGSTFLGPLTYRFTVVKYLSIMIFIEGHYSFSAHRKEGHFRQCFGSGHNWQGPGIKNISRITHSLKSIHFTLHDVKKWLFLNS